MNRPVDEATTTRRMRRRGKPAHVVTATTKKMPPFVLEGLLAADEEDVVFPLVRRRAAWNWLAACRAVWEWLAAAARELGIGRSERDATKIVRDVRP